MSTNYSNPTSDVSLSQTHVYLRDVQTTQNDSLSKIVALVPPGSTVLDVGTGSGALGRHLHARSACVVDGITYNEDEAALAKSHYRKLVVMDLERQPLNECFDAALYDVIVCADVLEHLRNASAVLHALGALLKPGGVVLVSLPNVTHLGVILGLMAGRFVRTREGLLDATHVHFMDRAALLTLVHEAGFAVTHEDAVRRNLVDTEFANLNFQALPQVVRSYVLSLPDAEVYQFVWTLALRPQDGANRSNNDNSMARPPATPVIEQLPRFRTQLYLDRGNGFSEADCVEAYGVQSNGLQTLVYSMDAGADVQALRLDFSDRPGQLEFVDLVALDGNGEAVWTWAGDWAANQTYHQCDWTGVRGWFGGRIVRAIGDDPWVRIPLQAAQWAGIQRVELRMSSPQPMGATDWPGLDVKQLQEQLTGISAALELLSVQATQRSADLATALQLAELRQADIDTLRRELAAVLKLAELQQTEIETLRRELAAVLKLAELQQTEIETLRRELAASQEVAASRAEQVNAILVSHSWRFTAALRWLSQRLGKGLRR